jgi:hypothetical protein
MDIDIPGCEKREARHDTARHGMHAGQPKKTPEQSRRQHQQQQ